MSPPYLRSAIYFGISPPLPPLPTPTLLVGQHRGAANERFETLFIPLEVSYKLLSVKICRQVNLFF